MPRGQSAERKTAGPESRTEPHARPMTEANLLSPRQIPATRTYPRGYLAALIDLAHLSQLRCCKLFARYGMILLVFPSHNQP